MKEKKSKRKKIVLIVLAVLLVLLAVLAYWQRNNIQAVKNFASYSQSELEEKLQENDQKIKDAVNAAEEITVREVTEDERQALRDGSLTQEELTELLLEPAAKPEKSEQQTVSESETPEKKPEASKPEQSVQGEELKKPAVNQTENSDYQQKLSALIAKVYVLREEYLIALDNLQAAAESDYKSQSKAGASKSELSDMLSGYLARGNSLEKECDRRMDTIVVAMEKLIKENNGDDSIVDTVITTYSEEKSLKKAWYMSELERRVSN